MKLSTKSDGDHYYTRTGAPAYGCGIKVAREEGLLPSPSTILSVMAKPGLSLWAQRLAVETALEVGERVKAQVPDRADQIAQILSEAKAKSREAMDLGTAIHDLAEDILKGQQHDSTSRYAGWIQDYKARNILRTRSTEVVVSIETPQIAFAGRVDAIVEHQEVGLSVLDWKSTKVPRSTSGKANPKWYDTYLIQLAAYSYAIDGQPTPISVVVDTRPDDKSGLHEKIWNPIEVERGWKIFNLLYRLWCIEKKYEPHKIGN
tara:strand:- start:13142 stop:13924 length:783 start_codon:yes stop_codon:yes gene_type:complete